MFLPARQIEGIGASFGVAPAGALPAEGEAAIRAFQAAGLAALAALPLLLLASLALGLPLAGPALIAGGYLGVAFALASKRSRQAAVLSGVVFTGLVGWSLLCFLTQAMPTAWTVGAALLAPLFAAAPAFVRIAMEPDGARAIGRVLETGAAETDDASHEAAVPAPPPSARAAVEAEERLQSPGFLCDVEDAVGFALRYARAAAESRSIRLETAVEAGLLAACDRQTCRRIARALLDCAMIGVSAEGRVVLSARRLRGVVLLRVRWQGGREAGPDDGAEAASRRGPQREADARALVEAVGGTLIREGTDDEVSVSVRLHQATPERACMRNGKRSGAT